MKLEVYPLLLIIAIIIFYITTKKKKSETITDSKTEPKPLKEEVNLYVNETEEQFHLRCYDFISEWLNFYNVSFHVSPDLKSFNIVVETKEGLIINYYIDVYFQPNKKFIMFYARITPPVPDNKLTVVSEFVNRINEQLFINSLYLNYESRAVQNRLICYVGNASLSNDQFGFYYGMLMAVKVDLSVRRLVVDNENPALVALDWSN